MVGRLDESVKKNLVNIKNKNFILLEEVPHKELDFIYRRIKIGFILYKGINLNFEYCAPNKLYEYWSNGIYVIAHPLKGVQNVVVESKMGKLLNLEIIEPIVNLIEEKCKEKNSDRKAIIDLFERKYSIDKFLPILDDKIKELIDG